MKKLFLSTLIVLCALCAQGQTGGGKNIAISVVAPQQVEYLDAAQTTWLSKKLLDIAVKSGLSAAGRSSGVIMYPVFTIESEDVVEGGMQNLTVVSADISFVVQHLEGDIVFATHNVQVRGSGSTHQRAINSALSNISVKDADFSRFIATARQKVLDYYTGNCSNIQLAVQSATKRKNYETAIALLASIPDAAPCYPQALQEIDCIYPEYQKQQCNETVQKAQSLYSAHKYTAALWELYGLKIFDTGCTQEAKALSATIEAKLSAEEQREWDYMVQRDNNRTTLAEKRLETIQSIAETYYSRQITNYHYTLLY
ncbi:MAG: hypothetical protein LBR26_04770 [Prevotella sp.]|jgi:hypothetical protein|nr:hypothetical protein [Prevotella sp.]